ncbi:MAG: argininosuccinate lyase, partial [Nitrospira sp.]|nr:argininosuccinate lyase [Nitrospira sp.]
MATAKRTRRTAAASGKAWGGRFRENTNRLVEAFTVSVAVDRRLYAHDIQGSIAHCQTLGKARVLSPRETKTIVRGLALVKTELDRGQFKFAPHDEDIHMAIERRLTELIGPLGGKLHTGRSRNDQVALDIRLYLRDRLDRLTERCTEFQRVVLAQAQANLPIAMPGYTHLQRAQPVLFAHHLLAYVEMVERDKGRFRDAKTRLNVMPLGSGALAGTNYPVDRRYT